MKGQRAVQEARSLMLVAESVEGKDRGGRGWCWLSVAQERQGAVDPEQVECWPCHLSVAIEK